MSHDPIFFEMELHKAGLDPATAADELGLSPRQIKRYISGECHPSKLVRGKISELVARRVSPNQTQKSFKFIDLFAGIGGMRLGFEAIGGKCIFTSERDRFSQKTYLHNFPDGEDHKFAGDIRPYGQDPSKIPEFDVLLAGFPCQPFSLAGVSKKNSLGRAHGFACEDQGNLFFDIARIIDHHRPAAFLLENVKNLQSHDEGNTFDVIRRTLTEELGYKIDFRIINSAPFVPQKRQRIFIVGFREDVGFSFEQIEKKFPPKEEWPTLGAILQGHNEIDSKYTLTPKLWAYLQAYREKHEKAGNGFGFTTNGPGDVARTLSARYHKDGSEILISQKGTRPRRLTPRECARLMGFERNDREWIIPVSDTQAYRQFGNAVVVPVVEAIARHMEPALGRALAKEQVVASRTMFEPEASVA
ncbi:DNA (cytosine-5-)-methyltransferase [Parerythrobacter jejuensis]|uniref:Cytosine-specific methyltransferase n=1 Tax=Parerythrobacter jejuensis TaxID=795812 RepID=A0A845AN97_9SPHN|nr:DNA (cytosine-5-)-methyltransferase [Parerythrobacter jejuensis]MXP30643.1 DNA (cytosine-5-)-methyltransferase [Parerythrobacter jejuensis]MXP33403.1 DNA (cytosine-5-)-methyltransferase [Parerythrobacter jejuensis]